MAAKANRARLEQLLAASMRAAEQGARVNSVNDHALVITFFLITRDGRLQLVAWERDDHPRDAVDEIKEMVKRLDIAGMVLISEVYASTAETRSMPLVEQMDGVLIYGYLPGDRNNPPVESVRSFVREVDGTLTDRNMYLPEGVMAWVQEALS